MTQVQDFTVLDHHLGYIKTFSGKKINLRNPSSSDIDLADIGASLSKICRFGGHCSEFYSVAQHSVLVALMAPEPLRGAALLHDATEAYLGDVVKPLKVILGPVYNELEMAFEQAIRERFHWLPTIGQREKEEIKKCDILALQIEDEAFRNSNRTRLRYFYNKFEMLQTDSQLGWPPYLAFTLFTKYANRLI